MEVIEQPALIVLGGVGVGLGVGAGVAVGTAVALRSLAHSSA